MRDGDWKLVRPAVPLQAADERSQAAMDRYVEMDIRYKYHPDEVTELMDDPPPEIVVPDPLPAELYNVADDPFEETDLADAEPDRVSTMLSALEAWAEEIEHDRRQARP